ncbi:hypothetical protein SLS62_006527 [Diatrype stigma]|uniref:Uncharacterized protein n=1 Tax=Diatrype stigma TaxID=117547 RepID=A0AAN9YR26_9PEZI
MQIWEPLDGFVTYAITQNLHEAAFPCSNSIECKIAPTRLWRAASAVPFLLIAAWCFQAMDLGKIDANAQPYADAGVIQWDGDNKVEILDNFHGVRILDEIWRGSMATFSPSTFGYDAIGSWQVFSFLIDLGPVFAIWILESTRAANAWSPAYI